MATRRSFLRGLQALVTSQGPEVPRNALLETDGIYRVDLDDLAQLVAGPTTRALALCNHHNPVGRDWNEQELRDLARLGDAHDVTVIADETTRRWTDCPAPCRTEVTSPRGRTST
ncbi:MAG: cystathionine beta-lyase [Glaciecola sp.]|jgi:cystathionine beta-lyase